jgi:prepilin-type N-terminal cleavage/methylation domain-containing protein
MDTKESKKKYQRGFTLLEIMVALALLALSFTALFLVQGRATNIALEARMLSIATQLARYQLQECKREAQKIIASASDFKLEGDFKELGFEKFTWECHAPKFNMKPPSASQVESSAKAHTPDANKKDSKAAAASNMSPYISLITDTLGNSVRELAVIVRDDTGNELRVVTHIIELSSMQALARMLGQGAEQVNKIPGAKAKKSSGQPAGLGSPQGGEHAQ